MASSECDVSSVDYVHSVIIDCSSISFVDSAAVTTLSQVNRTKKGKYKKAIVYHIL